MKGVEIIKFFTYDYMDYLMYQKTFLLWFDHFLDPWAEICQIFRWFFGKFKKSKRHSEIIWPLARKGFAFLNKIKHLGNSEAYCANGSLDSFLCRSGIVYNEGGPCKNMLGCLKFVLKFLKYVYDLKIVQNS